MCFTLFAFLALCKRHSLYTGLFKNRQGRRSIYNICILNYCKLTCTILKRICLKSFLEKLAACPPWRSSAVYKFARKKKLDEQDTRTFQQTCLPAFSKICIDKCSVLSKLFACSQIHTAIFLVITMMTHSKLFYQKRYAR